MKEQARLWWNEAVRTVQEAGGRPQQFAPLIERLAERDPHVSVPAIWALQQAGPIVVPLLVAGLQHAHTRVRRTCVDVIDHGGYGGDARCVAGLLPLLHDPVPHIRQAVWHTLFCERCQDDAQCGVGLTSELDRVALLIDVGLQDANLKLRRQLVADLCQHTADPRVPPALQQVLATETDAHILSTVRASL